MFLWFISLYLCPSPNHQPLCCYQSSPERSYSEHRKVPSSPENWKAKQISTSIGNLKPKKSKRVKYFWF